MTALRSVGALGGLILLAATAVGLVGCQSTQDRARRLAKQGSNAFKIGGLTVGRANPNVKVLGTQLLHDQNGSAVVAELRSSAPTTLTHVPLGLRVSSRSGASLYQNDVAGLQPSLVEAAVLAPGKVFTWIDDQLPVDPTGGRARITPGQAKPPSGPVPLLVVSHPTLSVDPTSGPEAKGRVVNRSRVLQLRLVVFVTARKGGRLVAAGRGVVNKLAPGAVGSYSAFFIGDPTGATLTAEAPPVSP